MLYELETAFREQGWTSDFVYDAVHDLYRFPDGEFAFSKEYANEQRLQQMDDTGYLASIGRARDESAPTGNARSALIRELNTARGEDLDEAVLRGGRWARERPYDVEVAEALDRAEKRLA